MTAKKKVGRIAHTAAVAASQRVIDVQNALHELLQRCVGQLAASRFGSGEEKPVMTDLTATKRHLEGGEGRGGEIRFEEKGHGGFEAVIHGKTVGFLKIRERDWDGYFGSVVDGGRALFGTMGEGREGGSTIIGG